MPESLFVVSKIEFNTVDGRLWRWRCVLEDLEQLLKESEDDALRRQVRGVLGAVGAIKDRTVPRVGESAQPRLNNVSVTAAGAGKRMRSI